MRLDVEDTEKKGGGLLGVWDTDDGGSFVQVLGANVCPPKITGRRWNIT